MDWWSSGGAVLLEIVAELATNGDRPSDAEILAEVRGDAIQDDDEGDVVYDESPAHPSVFERSSKFFNGLRYSATYIRKNYLQKERKKSSSRTIDFRNLYFCILYYTQCLWCLFRLFIFLI